MEILPAKLVQQLLRDLGEFHDQTASKAMEEFVAWLNNRYLASDVSEQDPKQFIEAFEAYAPPDKRATIESAIVRHITVIFKHLKVEAQTHLAGHIVLSIEEVGLLATVLGAPGIAKSLLIRSNMLEISTGTDIINKMIRNGVLLEVPDQADRRVKRIHLTPIAYEGLQVIFKVLDEMANQMLSELTLQERILLFQLLSKVDGSFNSVKFAG